MRPASTLAVALLAAAALAAGAAGAGAPALSLGWFGGACDDAAAQNPGDPRGCRYAAREAACGNRVDDDSDEAADCADPDCAGDAACPTPCPKGERDADGDCLLDEEAYPLNHACANFSDDDGDLATDCADPDCAGYPACRPEICRNGADDDADGQADCADSECASTGDCWACLYRGEPGDCDPICTPSAEVCGDGIDQDCDGQDLACGCPWWQLWGCGEKKVIPVEDCANERDDDGDGWVDCADPGCDLDGVCGGPAEDCGDGYDNDGDGWADCWDSECSIGQCATFPGVGQPGWPANPSYPGGDPRNPSNPADPASRNPKGGTPKSETDCHNGLDDDADGPADCGDTDCTDECETDCPGFGQPGMDCSDPRCQGDLTGETTGDPGQCFDGGNRDGDCYVDCEDPECAGAIEREGQIYCKDAARFKNILVGGDGVCDEEHEFVSVEKYCNSTVVREGAFLYEDAGTLCADGIDNDGDGKTDAALLVGGNPDEDCGAENLPMCPDDGGPCNSEDWPGNSYACVSGITGSSCEVICLASGKWQVGC